MYIKESFPYKLSILLVTYNHEKHIRQALDALISQEFDGKIELVIADDCSTDSTLSIIDEYKEKDPRFVFEYLDGETNLGITRNYQRGFSACSGEYIAVLEGDDYWSTPKKLKSQIEFLDTHWETSMCSVNYFVYQEEISHFYPRTTVGTGHKLISARDLIADNLVGNFSTCMYRNSVVKSLKEELYSIRSYDWIVNICAAEKAMIGFLEEPMSVYRLHGNGVWSQSPDVEKLQTQLDLIPLYDKLTEQIYHHEFSVLAHRLQENILALNITDLAQPILQPAEKGRVVLVDIIPPILLSAIRLLTPPIIKRLILKATPRGVL
ncbi:glycosyltransferase [Oceanicoccus sagamiensis]|uniref:Glycosyl transferase n=1 Tax=Oceanicoccus sagamiensis TaxID=716816 RepID=A0A1X9NEA5_9GAMM|nr:glycosyltransferase [Oceanicoccus sagamiensis]ARN73879.1 glycosyl transferase [Oceanicoccus sagamiensis]